MFNKHFVSGRGTYVFSFSEEGKYTCLVRVTGGEHGTIWSYTLGCPNINMMQHKPFYSLNKESYKPISQRSFLHEQYEAINSFIELNFDEKFHGLIAKPIKSGEHVNWYNENLSGKIQKLDKFEGQQLEELKKKYNALVHQINFQCERFENSDDENNKAWAESIREVFDINRNMVFSNGDEITIIWEFKEKENIFATRGFSTFN